MQIYLDSGYLNIPEIAKHPGWLKVIIGARQVGKTYGTLKYHVDNDIPHILLRRTSAELQLIGDSVDLNPYKVLEPEHRIGIFKQGKYYRICDYDEEGKPQAPRGMALSLAMISHIRGFSGRSFASIIYDEAIPEKGVIVRQSEGDSLLNAYTTINGNRELEGCAPCQLWLLANSNDINSPVLDALNLTEPILKMRRRGLEMLSTDDYIIVQPNKSPIAARRSQSALMRQISSGSEFYGMAINNEFSYDQSPLIINMPLKGLSPLFNFDSRLYAWEGDNRIYICRAPHKGAYYAGRYGAGQLVADYRWIKRYYAEGLVYFSDAALLGEFKRLFKLDY